MDSLIYLFYGIPSLAVLAWFIYRRGRLERRSIRMQEEARSAGAHEPATLHPVIDPARCIGCG
ncbi:MAG: hypothetical protein JOY91_00690, partial [Sinobacteraceae bacterium]|nr:hypothetical protein [Nevskiaceae bacterium]